MPLPELRLESVDERDIDLLLLEELEVSEPFRRWFWSSCGLGYPEHCAMAGVWHSISHPKFGESDLIVLVCDGAGPATALLVENKVDAPPQPDQATRYRRRGEA